MTKRALKPSQAHKEAWDRGKSRVLGGRTQQKEDKGTELDRK